MSEQQPLQVDPQAVIKHLTERCGSLELELAVQRAALEQVRQELEVSKLAVQRAAEEMMQNGSDHGDTSSERDQAERSGETGGVPDPLAGASDTGGSPAGQRGKPRSRS